MTEAGAVFARIEFADTAPGRYAARLVSEEVLRGISIDGAALFEYEVRWELVDEDGEIVQAEVDEVTPDIRKLMRWRVRTVYERAELGASTLVSIPAYADARLKYTGPGFSEGEGDSFDASKVDLAELEEISASALPTYPAKAFPRVKFTGPTALRFRNITARNGEKFGCLLGHLAPWDVPHLASADTGKKIVLRRDDMNLDLFNKGEVHLDDGSTVWTGYITVGTRHARGKRGRRLSNSELMDHYDRSDLAGAVVHAWKDDHGIAVCGITKGDATREQIRQVMECPPSVHARRSNGVMTLYGVLSVPIPGYGIARSSGGIEDFDEIAASWFGASFDEGDVDLTEGIADALAIAASDAAMFS